MYHFGASSAPQHCQPAYSLNQGFLISQYLVVVVVVCVLSVVLACFAANFRLGKRWNFQVGRRRTCMSLLESVGA